MHAGAGLRDRHARAALVGAARRGLRRPRDARCAAADPLHPDRHLRRHAGAVDLQRRRGALPRGRAPGDESVGCRRRARRLPLLECGGLGRHGARRPHQGAGGAHGAARGGAAVGALAAAGAANRRARRAARARRRHRPLGLDRQPRRSRLSPLRAGDRDLEPPHQQRAEARRAGLVLPAGLSLRRVALVGGTDRRLAQRSRGLARPGARKSDFCSSGSGCRSRSSP